MGFGGRVGGRKGGRGECRRGLAAWAWREVGRKGRLRAVQDLRVREKRWGRGGGGFNEASRAQRTGNCVKIRRIEISNLGGGAPKFIHELSEGFFVCLSHTGQGG
ncbi:hypothetical protein JHK82_043519 [Glycine max]|nr:hypothetical protein JHK82_043519 [Glycine max]